MQGLGQARPFQRLPPIHCHFLPKCLCSTLNLQREITMTDTKTLEYHIVPVTAFQQNCSLLVDPESRRAAIVDPGGDVTRILAKLDQVKAMPEKILVTHAHLDHAGAVATLAETLHLPIEGPHEGDQFWIDALAQQASMFGLPTAKSFKPDRWLHDGDQVTVGNITLDVRHCPGHTPGHVVFIHKPSKLAVVGDVLFQGSIGRTDFPGGDHETLLRSIKEKLLSLDEDVAFIPGHGPMSTMGEEKRSNPFVAGRYR
jgi:glyoxylase-like metal-dependent hydrolase (beta-lactamase superfamily II)